jgi:tRNA threonylcarbamoyladenosine biosynthesis protein TsaE
MISRQFQITTRTPEETQQCGKTIGKGIEQPLVIGLSGELGSGKTAFVQGLAAGLDVPGEYYITSPTFTLINEYPGRFPLFHIDLYRLGGTSDLEDIGLDEVLYNPAVTAIEWAEKMSDDLPAEHLTITFEITDNDCRRISLIAYGQVVVNLIKTFASSLKRLKNTE